MINNESMIKECMCTYQGKVLTSAEIKSARIPDYSSFVWNPYGKNLLSINLLFAGNTIPCRYTCTVVGRTDDVTFTYSSENYVMDIVVPVVGLYASQDTNVIIVLTDEDENEYNFTFTFNPIDESNFEGHLTTIDIQIYNAEAAAATIGNGWFFTGVYMDAYDKNGDLRYTGATDDIQINQSMKINDNMLYVEKDYRFYIYAGIYEKINLIGKTLGTLVAPDETGFHHDLTWDEDGYAYCLASPLNYGEVDSKREGIIVKYLEETGEVVAIRDYTEWYADALVGLDSAVNDVHFNSITYVKEIGQLIINSRNSSSYMGLDKYTLLPIWNVQNPVHDLLLDEKLNLTVVNPDEFIYPNGEHTVFVTNNEKYEAYRGDGKIVMTIFDNVACVDENRIPLVKHISDTNQDDDAGYPWNSAIQVVAIDLHKMTIEQLDRFEVEGQRSRITSSVFDSADNKYFYFYIGVPSNFYVVDTEGNVCVAAENLFPPDVEVTYDYTYRGRIFSYNEIIALTLKE